MEPHTNNISDNYDAFAHDTGQDMSLDLSSFATDNFDFGDLSSNPVTATTESPPADATRTSLSHDDSCLNQPACFGPYSNPYTFDTHTGSRHMMQPFHGLPSNGMAFHNPNNHHQQHAQMVMPHTMAPIQHHPQSQSSQRSLGRSASFSMASPAFGQNGFPPTIMTSPHPAESCHQTTCPSQSCPVRKDELAANALVSFAGGQQPSMDENAHTCCHFISPDETLFQFPVELPAWNHILSCHGQEQPAHCVSPCPAESPLVFRECHIPMQFTATPGEDGSGQRQDENSVCGFRFSGPLDYIHHFNEYHRSVLPIAHEHHHSMLSPPLSPTDPLSPGSDNEPEASPGQFSLNEDAQFGLNEETPFNPTEETPFSLNEDTQYMCFWKDRHGVVCRQNCKDGEELQKHVQEIHLKSLPRENNGYCCKWQGCIRHKAFAQRSKLGRHIQTHTGFKAEICPICEMRLSAKQSLNQHLLTHSGEKPWECDFPGCGIRFRQQSALTMHKRTHTGEKPLVCETCGKAFSESSNLSKHRKIHSDELPLKCSVPECTKAFRRPDQLRRHMESHIRKQKKQAAAAASGSGPNPLALRDPVQIQPQSHPMPETKTESITSGRNIDMMDAAGISSSEGEICGDGECCFDEGCVDDH